MGITFGGWPESIHEDFEQVKRMISASKLKSADITLSADGETALIKGSGAEPYETTLEECTCPDFAIRNAPCKHMYRLAMIKGLIGEAPVYNKKSKHKIADELDYYRKLYDERKITTEAYAQICTALLKLDKKASRNDSTGDFDVQADLNRIYDLYKNGDISADTYIGIGNALSKI